MIRGLYTSGWSMMAINKQVDTITNNLANANTNGFKRDVAVFESFPEMLTSRIHDIRSAANPGGDVGTMYIGSDIGEIHTDYKQSKLIRTGSHTDIGIKGSDSAFFTVLMPGANGGQPELMYTRDGSFVMDAEGRLCTNDGYPVLGENGEIILQNADFAVKADGTVIQNGTVVDRLQIRDFQNTDSLRKHGNNLVQTTDETEEKPFEGEILQGFVEESNVNIIKEMVGMITAMRAYEANQKILRSQDETLQKTVNEVGAIK